MTIRVTTPFQVRAIRKDETTLPVSIRSTPLDLVVRLEPGAAQAGDWFTLRSSDGKVQQHLQLGAGELRFAALDPGLLYSLSIDPGAGEKSVIFADLSWDRLTQAPAPEPELREHEMILENQPPAA